MALILKRLLSGLFYTAIGLTLLTAFLIVLLFYGLRTETGQRLAANLVSAAVSSENFGLHIQGLAGEPPGRIVVEAVTLSDARGVWLEGRDVELFWDWTQIFRGRVHVESAVVASVGLLRRPESSDEEEDREPRQFRLPRLALDDVSIRRLLIGPEESPDRPALTLDGMLHADENRASLRLKAANLSAPNDFLRAEADWDVAGKTLAVDADFEESPGGVISSLINLPDIGAVSASLQGRGPLADWTGSLRARGAGLGSIDATLTAGYETVLRASLSGGFVLDPMGPFGQAGDYLGQTGTFSLEASVLENGGIPLDRLELSTDRGEFRFQGRFDPVGSELAGFFELTAKDLSSLRRISGLDISDGRRVEGRILVAPQFRRVTLSADLGALSYREISAANAVLKAEFESAPGAIPLRSSGDIELKYLETPWTDRSLDDVSIQYQADMDENGLVRVSKLDLIDPDLRVSASGTVDSTNGRLQAAAKVEADRLGLAVALFHVGISGRSSMTLEVGGDTVGPDLEVKVEGEVNEVTGLPPEAEALTGRDARLRLLARVTRSAVRIEEFEMTGRSELSAEGAFDLAAGGMDLNWQARIDDLAELSQGREYELQGPAVGQGRLFGPWASFAAEGELSLDRAAYGGRALAEPKLVIKLADLPGRIQGEVRLTGKLRDGAVDVRTNFAFLGESLGLTGLLTATPGVGIKGDLNISLTTGLLTGKVDLDSSRLDAVAELLNLPLSGSVRANIALLPKGGLQTLSGTGNIENPRYGNVTARRLTFRLDELVLTAVPTGSGLVEITGLSAAGAELETARLELAGGPREAGFKLEGKGNWLHPLDLRLAGSYSRTGGGVQLLVNSLTGSFDQRPVLLNRPVTADFGSGGWRVSDLDLSYGNGRLSGRGSLSGAAVSIEVAAENLPLELVGRTKDSGPAGALSGRVSVDGRPGSPRLSSQLDLTGLKPAGRGRTSFPTTDVSIETEVIGGRIDARAVVTGLDKEPGLMEISAPLRFSLRPFAFSIPSSGDVSGRLDAAVRLSLLPALLDLDDQVMDGRAELDLTLSGSVSNPDASGVILISDGRYEHLQAGLVFREIEARIAGNRSELRIEQAFVGDGLGGKASLSGQVELDPARGFPFQVFAELNRLRVVRLDLATVTASGEASIKGTTEAAEIEGRVDVNRAELTLPKQLPPSLSEIEVIEINNGAEEDEKTRPPDFTPYRIGVSGTIHTTGPVFLRGRGLDSEWSGGLNVSGSVDALALDGALGLVRGHYDFIGRRFTLVSGAISFIGVSPPTPWISMTGQIVADDATIVIRLDGPPAWLELEFDSVPALPRDEILARALFGRSLRNVSPIQALRLAQAAKELTGGPGLDVDIVGRLREIFQLDTADVRGGEEGSVTVGVGKYINEKVYVEAEGGTRPGESKVKVEIQLSPNLSLESEAGAEAQSGIKLRWKYDY